MHFMSQCLSGDNTRRDRLRDGAKIRYVSCRLGLIENVHSHPHVFEADIACALPFPIYLTAMLCNTIHTLPHLPW